MRAPLVTVVVPSFNQGRYLNDALTSIFGQNVPIEVFVMDGGSTDNSIEVIRSWEHLLKGWRSRPDNGQAAAINEGISQGRAPFVCWLNSDDLLLPNALTMMIDEFQKHPEKSVVYGKCWNLDQETQERKPVWVEPFNEKRLALRCIVSQPATLIRRQAWQQVDGLDERLHMVMDYDLWWKLYRATGPLHYLNEFVAVNRDHAETKTKTQRRKHYKEAISIVRKHYGRVPIKWWLFQPYAVWFKAIVK